MRPTEIAASLHRYHLLDVRELDEWDAGHIAGAQHIPLGELGTRVAEVPREKTVVCVCRGGFRSERACTGLRSLGFDAVNLDGGVAEWVRAGQPLVTSRETPGRVL